MAKIIKIDDKVIAELKEEFSKTLETVKLSDGKFTFSKVIGEVDRKADLFFTELSYIKMKALISQCNKEIAWHGLAKRGDDPEKDEYIIYDIMVYPQVVTGTTVETDQVEYQTWLMSQEDEVFNNIRMQGHSHVNMGVTPSGVDTSLYERILDQLEGDMFYIFLIYNKRGDKTIKIYDLGKNILFEEKDVTVYTLDDGTGMLDFLENAEKSVKDAPPVQKNNGKNTGKNTGKTAAGGQQAKKKRKQPVEEQKQLPQSNRWDNGYYDDYDGYYGGYYYHNGYRYDY